MAGVASERWDERRNCTALDRDLDRIGERLGAVSSCRLR
jgi:hypothetical protein